jgi:hypothetical protein
MVYGSTLLTHGSRPSIYTLLIHQALITSMLFLLRCDGCEAQPRCMDTLPF